MYSNLKICIHWLWTLLHSYDKTGKLDGMLGYPGRIRPIAKFIISNRVKTYTLEWGKIVSPLAISPSLLSTSQSYFKVA